METRGVVDWVRILKGVCGMQIGNIGNTHSSEVQYIY